MQYCIVNPNCPNFSLLVPFGMGVSITIKILGQSFLSDGQGELSCTWTGLVTVKILKFGTPQTIAVIVLKIEKFDVTLH